MHVSNLVFEMSATPNDIAHRLGLNVPRECWPAAGALVACADAGFRWVQFHTPPPSMLTDRRAARRHARAMRTLLDQADLGLVLHAPDQLSAGTPEGDDVFEALLDYAAEAGAERVAYHGLNFPETDGHEADRVRERATREEGSLLLRLLPRAHTLGVTVAIENLAPVFPGPRRLCHDPVTVRDLVRRLDSPAAGMLLDLGHLHVTADASRTDLTALVASCARQVVLFHVHDNLGARRRDVEAPGVDPLRLDLHLTPGAGTLPWSRIAGVVAANGAPLMLEVAPQHRPASLSDLHERACDLLTPATALHAAA